MRIGLGREEREFLLDPAKRAEVLAAIRDRKRKTKHAKRWEKVPDVGNLTKAQRRARGIGRPKSGRG